MPVGVRSAVHGGLVWLIALVCLLAWGSASALAALPDGRAYEAVSPVATEGSTTVYVPDAGSRYTDDASQYGIITGLPFEVAPDGDAVVYAGDPPPVGPGSRMGQSNGTTYLARRGSEGGWTVADLQPPGTLGAEYQAFSSDLSVGVLLAPSLGANGSSGVYSYATTGGAGGEYDPLVAGTSFEEVRKYPFFAGGNAGGNGAPSFSHLLFESEAAMEGEGTLEKELRVAAKGVVEEGKEPSILYDSVGGRLSVVNVLPDGRTDADASFGSFPTTRAESAPGFSNAISADGSRVFWTDAATGDLYVRESDSPSEAKTVQVDAAEPGCGSCLGGGGFFWTASSDGSRVLFTDESRLTADSSAKAGEPNLYEYEVNPEIGKPGVTTDLTAVAGADVQGVVGAGEDGEYIYLVAQGVLASNENGNSEKAEVGKDNLYLYHAGSTVFIAMLSVADGSEVIPFEENADRNTGDWQAALGHRTAEVTPDGHSLVFMSNRRLTGYDNEYSYLPPESHEIETRVLDEVFLYEAGTGQLRCVSCNPRGETPVATEFDDAPDLGGPLGAYIPITDVPTYRSQPRVVADDGGRVFFDSGEPLVPQDTNGWLDVYEWERDGTGSCGQSQGCVYLLSGGSYRENSYLIGGDSSGENAFFITTAQLVAQDRNDQDDVYDARVGGVQPSSPPVCEGAGCQGVPPSPPIFATPASVTFAGVGNFPPQVASVAEPKKKIGEPKRCTKGFVRKHGKCIRKRTHKSKKPANRSTKGRR